MDNLFKRYGVFCIPRETIKEHSKALMSLMGKVIIVKATAEYHTDSICYYAYSEYFDLVADGCEAVKYKVETNGIDVMFMDISQ